MKKVIFSAALLMGACAISFAGTPKGEPKDAKTETPAEVKTEVKAGFTYWVVGRNSDGTYSLVDQQPAGDPCTGGTQPCKIQSTTQHSDLRVDQEDVDTEQNGETVLEKQPSI